MTPQLNQEMLSAASGVLVGVSLGLIGGGGSVLGVPLMVYLVRVSDPHVAIGTSALGVAVNAVLSLAQHARARTVKWRCGAMYATAGVIGAWLGSSFGKIVDGERLLFLFALVMIVIAVVMVRRRRDSGDPGAQCHVERAPKVFGYGLVTGVFSGFFGIGGGFLIVPGLLRSTGMPMINAIGTSLVAVTAFGLATALNYSMSGLIDWGLAGAFIGGGFVGSALGARAARRLAKDTARLAMIFATIVFGVALYMLARTATAW
ncbi:MAG: sulfite exporter TauE/SafE family protein [Methylocystis sp.]